MPEKKVGGSARRCCSFEFTMIRITISDLEIIKNGKINSVYNFLEMHIENLFTSRTGNVSARVTLAEGSKKAQLPYHSW